MFRTFGFCAAMCAAVLAFASPARAQEAVWGAYCGELTWAGQAPVDAWIVFLRDGGYGTPLTAGPFTDATTGTRTQNGAALTMRSDNPPYYEITATAVNGRIVGDVSASDGRRGVISLRQMIGAGSALRSSPLPPDFDPPSAEAALAGDMQGVNRAITWAWTPQGSDYWRSVRESGALPSDAAAALRDWIRRDAAGERPACSAR